MQRSQLFLKMRYIPQTSQMHKLTPVHLISSASRAAAALLSPCHIEVRTRNGPGNAS
jgi:hypothetical protein